MKSLKSFENSNLALSTAELKNISGGSGKPVGNIHHTQLEKNTSADGTCCHLASDWWADTDGNGRQGVNEICQQDTQWKWVCD